MTGDTPAPAGPRRAPEPEDTPGSTPLASAPTPLEDDLAGHLAGHGNDAAAAAAAEPESNPTQIGRFTVLKRLGSGGMGVVYAAYDADLDRKVALKVLRTRVSRTKRDTGRARLLREAQAMAKLSHPNVVAIYDVGTVEDQVFLAMEFVKGVTLTKWLQAEKRAWRDVLQVFLQAGRGLSAAHRAGIIHRDFKPDNVLIDGEGRVRVVDFGLARADGGSLFARPDTYADAIKSMSGSSMLDMRITRTGGMTGTPAYMAPEQYLGHPTDARTDQFSFCVALYEGLHGLRPFLGDRVAIVREAVLGGQIQEVPKDTDVPVWLRKILLRGLAVRPAERYRSMDDLLARLADDPRSPARRWLAIAGACGLAGLVALGARELVRDTGRAPEPAPALELCDTDAALAGIWDPSRRQAVTTAFATSGTPGAEPLAGRVTAVLDAYAGRWRGQVAATCAQIRSDADRGAAEPLAACLRRRLDGLHAVTDALIRAEPRTIQRALVAAWTLPPVQGCAEPLAPNAAPWRPGDEGPRALLERAAVQGALGDLPRALASAKAVAAAATADENLPLQAEALHRQASLERAAGDGAAAERSLLAAMWAAEASRHDELLIDTQTLLLEVLGDLGRDEEAAALWQRLTAALLRHSDDGRRESAALHAIGRLLLRRGRYAEAATQLALALRLGERSLGAEHPQVGALLLDLAVAQARLGAHEEAARQLDRSVALLREALPADDPALVRVYLARADVELRRGRLREAAADYALAEQIVGATLSQDPAAAAEVQLGLARVALAEARWGAAEAGFARALALLERVHGPQDPALVEPLIGQCATATGRGQHEAAVLICRRALQVAERPTNAAGAGAARVALARALWAQALDAGTATPAVRGQIVGLARAGLDELQHAAHPDPLAVAAAAEWIAGHAGE